MFKTQNGEMMKQHLTIWDTIKLHNYRGLTRDIKLYLG